jgi:hypothetical protein
MDDPRPITELSVDARQSLVNSRDSEPPHPARPNPGACAPWDSIHRPSITGLPIFPLWTSTGRTKVCPGSSGIMTLPQRALRGPCVVAVSRPRKETSHPSTTLSRRTGAQSRARSRAGVLRSEALGDQEPAAPACVPRPPVDHSMERSSPTSRARPTHHLEMCRVSSTGCLSRSGKTTIQRSASASRKTACSPPASSSSLEPRARSAGARSSVGPLLGSPTPQAACPPTRSLARPVVGGPSSNCSGRSPPLGYRRLDDAPPAREGTREIKRSESPPPPSPSGLMIK